MKLVQALVALLSLANNVAGFAVPSHRQPFAVTRASSTTTRLEMINLGMLKHLAVFGLMRRVAKWGFVLDDVDTLPDGKTQALSNELWDPVLLDHLRDSFVPAAEKRMEAEADVFAGYIDDAVNQYRLNEMQEKDTAFSTIEGITEDMVTKYIMHALVGVDDLTAEEAGILKDLFVEVEKLDIEDFMYPDTPEKDDDEEDDDDEMDKSEMIKVATKLIYDSPALKDYKPSAATDNLSKEDYAKFLLPVVGIDGLRRMSLLAKKTMEKADTLSGGVDAAKAALEIARLNPPRNSLLTIVDQDEEVQTSQGVVTMPKGSVVAPNIKSACLDPEVFDKPDDFDPTRPNLSQDAVGLSTAVFGITAGGCTALLEQMMAQKTFYAQPGGVETPVSLLQNRSVAIADLIDPATGTLRPDVGLRVAGPDANVPDTLKGLFWLSDQGSASSLASFAMSNDGGKYSTSKIAMEEEDVGDELFIRVVGDRTWAMADNTPGAPGLTFVYKNKLAYRFRVRSAGDPKEFRILPSSSDPKILPQLENNTRLWLMILMSPERAESEGYPGSVCWDRPSKVIKNGKKINKRYTLVQVADMYGKPIQPAYDAWVKYQNDPVSGQTPGVIHYFEFPEELKGPKSV